MKGGGDVFLTKKAFWKILIMAIGYFVVGSFCVAAGAVLAFLGAGSKLLFVLGGICYALCPLFAVMGLYAEGKGKLIALGNKLVRNELKPAAFIREYEQLRHTAGLVWNKPSIEVLQLVSVAYDSLHDRENCLSVMDERIAATSEKKKIYAKLIKSSILFSYGRVEEAEALFAEACTAKQDFMCRALVDSILKGDRAVAMGEYKTAEMHCLNLLARTTPKLDNLGRLVIHFQLGEVYEKLQSNEQAIPYYQYCVDHGGETAIKEAARSALERVQQK